MTHTHSAESGQVATFFEGYASGFDSIYGHSGKRNSFQKIIDQHFRRTMFLRFKETLKHSANPAIESIIDIGCGPGHYCFEFLKQHKNVTGLDLSEKMLQIARRNAGTQHQNEHLRLIKADYLTHRFDHQFDAACLMGFFDYIKSPGEVFTKLKNDVTKEIYASFPKSGGLLSVQRKIRYRLRNCPLYLYSKKEVTGLIEAAGFHTFEINDCERDWFVRIVVSG